MHYIKLDHNILQLVNIIDSLFANNKDILLQIGYIICLTNATSKANIIHWFLIKYKRVTQSVLAAELYKIAYRFDIVIVIKATLEKILGSTILLILRTDSKSFYDCLVK